MSIARELRDSKLIRKKKNKRIRMGKLKRRQHQKLMATSDAYSLPNLFNRLINETTVDNYEEWVEKMNLDPDLRLQLDEVVRQERKRLSSIDKDKIDAETGNFEFGGETVVDEPEESTESESSGNFTFGGDTDNG